MNENIDDIIQDLQLAFNSFEEMEDAYYEFVPIAEKLIDRLNALPNPLEAFTPIFKLIEENEEAEYGLGSPGDIGHFLESYYQKGYEKYLLESLDRKPTFYTTFLLHRIIRDDENENRSAYLNRLKALSTSTNISAELKEELVDMLTDFN